MYDEALIAYENYLEKFPHDFNAWANKGHCFTALNETEKATQAYQMAKQINPRVNLQMTL